MLAGRPNLIPQVNRTLVLQVIRSHEPLSRVDISRLTGLSKPTVSQVVAGLLDGNLIVEVGRRHGRPGRRSRLFRSNPEAGYLLGIDLSDVATKLLLTNLSGDTVLQDRAAAMRRGGAMTVRQLNAGIHDLLKRARVEERRLSGIGVAVPGLVEPSSGVVLRCPEFAWHRVPLKSILEREFSTEIFVENDVNAAALAERQFGLARNRRSVVCIRLGVGIGAGIIVDDTLLAGAHSSAGEIGWMVLSGDWPSLRTEDAGQLESFVGRVGILRRLQRSATSAESTLAATEYDETSIAKVYEQLRRADPVVSEVFEEVFRLLGMAIRNLISVVDPEIVVLGGDLTRLHPGHIERIRSFVGSAGLTRPRIEVSALGDAQCALGAVALAGRSVRAGLVIGPAVG